MPDQKEPIPSVSQLSPVSRRAFFRGLLSAAGIGAILATAGCPSGGNCGYCDGPGADYQHCDGDYCDYVNYADA